VVHVVLTTQLHTQAGKTSQHITARHSVQQTVLVQALVDGGGFTPLLKVVLPVC
jgi:hypothetical protein